MVILMGNLFNKLQSKYDEIPTWTLIAVPLILAFISFLNFLIAFILGWIFFYIPFLFLIVLLTLTNREKRKRYLSILLRCTILLVIPCIFIAQPLIEHFKRLNPIYASQQDELATTEALQKEKRRLFIEQYPNNECADQKKREEMEDADRIAADKDSKENSFKNKIARRMIRTSMFNKCIDQLINQDGDSFENGKSTSHLK